MTQKFILSGSILSANWLQFGTDIEKIIEAGIDWLHIDMMDYQFVPNLTLGPELVRAIQSQKNLKKLPFLDIHLMVNAVDPLIDVLGNHKVDQITIHIENNIHLDRMIQKIKSWGCRAAVALNPATPVCLLDPILSELDMILIMSVNPGFSNQKPVGYIFEKIKTCRKKIDALQASIRLAVDGGVKVDTIRQYAQAGADTFVIGSGLFGTSNYLKTVQLLRSEIEHVR